MLHIDECSLNTGHSSFFYLIGSIHLHRPEFYHSCDLHPSFSMIFAPNSGYIARYSVPLWVCTLVIRTWKYFAYVSDNKHGRRNRRNENSEAVCKSGIDLCGYCHDIRSVLQRVYQVSTFYRSDKSVCHTYTSIGANRRSYRSNQKQADVSSDRIA